MIEMSDVCNTGNNIGESNKSNINDIKEILEYRTIAVVGCSTNPEKDANKIPRYLQENGYRIIPVNPFASEILGQRAYPSLVDIPDDIKVDVVMIFRPAEDVPSIVDHAIEIGARAVWMPLGIRNEDAARKAQDAGLKVVQDRCMKAEHQKTYF